MIGTLTTLDFGLALVGLLLLRLLYSRKPPAPLPPGPKGWPLLGNLLDVPTSKEWLTFTDWGNKWGDLVSISVFGQRMVIVNSAKVATEMLDKKSAIYSDRPVIPMGGEMIGWKNSLGLLPYGSRFRNYRRLFHQLIGSNVAMSRFHPVEEAETRKFLQRLLSTPQDLSAHIRQTAGAVILRISHGYEVNGKDDRFVQLAELAIEQFSLSTAPGRFFVNLVPALSRLPDWFPGTNFKKIAREWTVTLNQMVEEPHQYVKDQLASGVAEPSFTSKLLEEPDLTPQKEFDIKWSANSLYGGGADTTVASVYSFFKAMMLFPEVAARAQAEIDTVVGQDRLPSFADKDALPFTNALVLEVLRWHAVGPTGVPHVVTEDNIHDGYLIPKGSVIITNIWKMLRDPDVYSDPMKFNPDRFLGPNPERDPRKACFGFGRRICPGQIMAEASIFISCAMTLAVFDISKHVENGKVIEPDVDQLTGTVSHPTPFQCTITPRSEKALALINAADN